MKLGRRRGGGCRSALALTQTHLPNLRLRHGQLQAVFRDQRRELESALQLDDGHVVASFLRIDDGAVVQGLRGQAVLHAAKLGDSLRDSQQCRVRSDSLGHQRSGGSRAHLKQLIRLGEVVVSSRTDAFVEHREGVGRLPRRCIGSTVAGVGNGLEKRLRARYCCL